MATDEERREVAARLRERESVWCKNMAHVNVVPGIPSTQYEDMAALLGFSGWTLGADVFARLADLIDRQERTCHNIDKGYWWFKCSECGVALEEEDDMGYTTMQDEHGKPIYEPRYCPNCGARIIKADGVFGDKTREAFYERRGKLFEEDK